MRNCRPFNSQFVHEQRVEEPAPEAPRLPCGQPARRQPSQEGSVGQGRGRTGHERREQGLWAVCPGEQVSGACNAHSLLCPLPQLFAAIVFISFGVVAAFCCAIVDGVFAARHIVSSPHFVLHRCRGFRNIYKNKSSSGRTRLIDLPGSSLHLFARCCFYFSGFSSFPAKLIRHTCTPMHKHAHVWAGIYMHTHAQVTCGQLMCAHTVHSCTHVHAHAYRCVRTLMCMHTCAHTHRHRHTQSPVHVHAHTLRTLTHICAHVHTRIYSACTHSWAQTHATLTCTHMYAHTHEHVCTQMHSHTLMCTHTCTLTHSHTQAPASASQLESKFNFLHDRQM